MFSTLQGLAGLVVFTTIAWILSHDRQNIDRKIVAGGLFLQLVLALLLLKLPFFNEAFLLLNGLLLSLETATRAGTSLVFGFLGGGPLPFAETGPGSAFVLAFRALPLVLVISALSALLFHWRVLPFLVRQLSRLLQKTMRIHGALGLGAAANVFVGMVEAPLFVRPYIRDMSRSDLFALMVCGMATIAGTVMVLYASIISNHIPGAMGHILTASLISAPAALVMAHIMIPGDPSSRTVEVVTALDIPSQSTGAMDAVTHGTLQGMQLLINIIAMLIVLVALVSLVNLMLGVLPDIEGKAITLEYLLGLVMAPLTWLMGIPWAEAQTAGMLMGTKTVLNELLAYLQLAGVEGEALSQRSRIIMTYALCGFANFGSLGIMIGGLSTMVPERRADIVSLGMRSIVAGTLATLMTGALAGLLLP